MFRHRRTVEYPVTMKGTRGSFAVSMCNSVRTAITPAVNIIGSTKTHMKPML